MSSVTLASAQPSPAASHTTVAAKSTKHGYNQVYMEAALKSLTSAKRDLQAANHDKDDYRYKAIGLIDQAVAAVNAGIAAAGGEVAPR